MATGTAYGQVEMNQATWDVSSVPIMAATQMRLLAADGSQQDFYGSGFTYGESPTGLVVLSGTVTRTDFSYNGTLGFKVTNLSHDAGFMYHLFDTGNLQGLLGYVFNGNDVLNGSAQADILIGYAGGDSLKGNGGADTLNGSGGNDMLEGGGGKDVLIGGLGTDRFIFDAPPSAASADTIKDFKGAEGDKIVVNHLDFAAIGTSLTSGEFRAATDISATGGATTTSQHILYDTDSGHLYYDVDGSASAHAPVLIATVNSGVSHAALQLTSFIVT
jgi:Ca2+-binding RTX toxin-like protein